jgi:hypothetical protein
MRVKLKKGRKARGKRGLTRRYSDKSDVIVSDNIYKTPVLSKCLRM